MEAFSIQAEVPGGPDAARHARRLIRAALLGRMPGQSITDVALLVTELVANGVRHGGAVGGTALQLRLQGHPQALRVEVGDPGARRQAVAVREPDVDAGGGFGLQLVERVASRWGVGDGPRTSVWFEVDCR